MRRPARATTSRSSSSRSRTPTMCTRAGSTWPSVQTPQAADRHMPPRKPLGVVSGVLKSPWASSQRKRTEGSRATTAGNVPMQIVQSEAVISAGSLAAAAAASRDRKSTRLNSSHSSISYAVFCLKKKIPTVNTTGYIDHAAFLGTINPDTTKIPKHLFQVYLNIYNNYFKATWMPDRTEAKTNELNQDDACYCFFFF